MLNSGQRFTVTELHLHELTEAGYYDETVMNPASVAEPVFICIGHDKDNDPVALNVDIFKPEYLELSVEEIHKLAFTHPYTFWVSKEDIQEKFVEESK